MAHRLLIANGQLVRRVAKVVVTKLPPCSQETAEIIFLVELFRELTLICRLNRPMLSPAGRNVQPLGALARPY